MGICYVVTDPFIDKLEKSYDPSDARELVEYLQRERDRLDDAAHLFRKEYTGYQYLKQIRHGDWRVVAVFLPLEPVAEVVHLSYVYRKNESGEPNDDILERIDAAAADAYAEAPDWPPDKQSEYLDQVRTQLPDV